MWLDDCEACAQALQREAAVRPRRVLCLKTGGDRVYVTAELLHDVLSRGDDLEALCYLPNDYVREVFVVGDDALQPPANWWSLSRHEDEMARPHDRTLRSRAKPVLLRSGDVVPQRGKASRPRRSDRRGGSDADGTIRHVT